MAFENLMGMNAWTADASTGMRRYRFIKMNTDGTVGYPSSTAGVAVDGVIRGEGTTGSTASGQAVAVYPMGSIALVEAAASTMAVGDLVQASSVGQAEPLTAGAYAVGRVIAGSSGAANRVLSIRIENIGTT